MLDVIRFTSILVTHFILNLRTFDNGSVESDKSLHFSDIHFARSIAGNIGAPLQNSFEISDQGQLGAPIQQQIENPLSIGILAGPSTSGPRSVLINSA